MNSTVCCQNRIKSTHKVEVVRVFKKKLEGSDNLSLVSVFDGGHQVVVNSNDWVEGSLGAYVVPDSLVDTKRPEFSFLAKDAKEDGTVRIKTRKIRGTFSEGLLVPAPAGSQEGDDVADILGVTRHDPDAAREKNKDGSKKIYLGSEDTKAPSGLYPKYDVDSWQRYKSLLIPGEEVFIFEKIHGCNSRYTYLNGVMYCGSREHWKKPFPSYDHLTKEYLVSQGMEEEKAIARIEFLKTRKHAKNLWWRVLDLYPQIEQFCKLHETYTLYGEVYGQVQDLKYGAKNDEVFFAAFDVWNNSKKQYVEIEDALSMLFTCGVPVAPMLYKGLYSEEIVRELGSGPTTISNAGHCREGIVIRPRLNRYHESLGRVVLKYVSPEYLSRAK